MTFLSCGHGSNQSETTQQIALLYRKVVGVVGPGSGAEQAQNTVHRMRHFEEALDWGSQLQNEPAVNLKYARVGAAKRPLDVWFVER